MANANPYGQVTSAYVTRFMASVRGIVSAQHRQPNLIDGSIPTEIVPPYLAPFNQYSYFFPLFDKRLRYSASSKSGYVVGLSGELAPVTLRRLATGALSAATAAPIGGSGAAPAQARAGAACVPAGPPQSLRIPLNHPIAGPATASQLVPGALSDLPYTIRVSYMMPSRSAVAISLGNSSKLTFAHYQRIGASRRGALQFLDLSPVGVGYIQLNLPGGACITGVTVSHYTPVTA
jgi:hypothetical protein